MNSDLQNKLFHFEADPPKEVWDKVADALAADTEQDFPQRLFHYEEQPPVGVWNKVESSLDEPEPAIKVIPITRYKKPLRYVAAAASIIAAVMLVVNLTNKKTGAGAVIGGTETTISPSSTNQASVVPFPEKHVVPTTNSTQTIDTDLTEEKLAVDERKPKRHLTSIRPANILQSFSFSRNFIPKRVDNESLFDYSSWQDYMIYSDDEGTAMRVPKKAFALVNCEKGDNSCKERIRQLQQKMATTTATTDFGGVLEILRQLQ